MDGEPQTTSREARGATVEEAVAAGARLLGVGPDEVDVVVLDQPRRGLLSRRQARVRVSVRTTPETAGATVAADGESGWSRPAVSAVEGDAEGHAGPAVPDRPFTSADDPGSAESPVRRAPEAFSGTATGPQTSHARPNQEDPVTDTTANEAPDEGEAPEELSPEERLDQLDEEAEIAADFIEGLLDILSLPGDIEIVVREEQALVNINEVGSGLLIGRRGATLDALQELVRCATQRRTERRAHVRVDVEGYRERQLEKLREKCRDAIAEVREHGEPVRLEPMDPYERKMMHDVVGKASGVTSTSEGNEPRRRVVIHPSED